MLAGNKSRGGLGLEGLASNTGVELALAPRALEPSLKGAGGALVADVDQGQGAASPMNSVSGRGEPKAAAAESWWMPLDVKTGTIPSTEGSTSVWAPAMLAAETVIGWSASSDASAGTPSAGNPDAPKETLPDGVIYPCPGSRTTPGGPLPPDVRAFSRFSADLESSVGIFRETVCSPDADCVQQKQQRCPGSAVAARALRRAHRPTSRFRQTRLGPPSQIRLGGGSFHTHTDDIDQDVCRVSQRPRSPLM